MSPGQLQFKRHRTLHPPLVIELSEAKPMSGNTYKVQIAKTAVKRAIMNAAGIKTV